MSIPRITEQEGSDDYISEVYNKELFYITLTFNKRVLNILNIKLLLWGIIFVTSLEELINYPHHYPLHVQEELGLCFFSSRRQIDVTITTMHVLLN